MSRSIRLIFQSRLYFLSDFSRWIAEVFGDYPLAKRIEALERKYRTSGRDVAPQIVEAIRLRYRFVDPVLGLPD